MAVQLLMNSCGVAEYRGTNFNTAKEVLRDYTKQRAQTDKNSYAKPQHTFVVMTVVEGYVPDFKDYIRRHKLGTAVISEFATNINHSGDWYVGDTYGGRKLCVIVYKPDHKKLTEWYQKNYDKDYKL